MRISDWSSDLCASDLVAVGPDLAVVEPVGVRLRRARQGAYGPGLGIEQHDVAAEGDDEPSAFGETEGTDRPAEAPASRHRAVERHLMNGRAQHVAHEQRIPALVPDGTFPDAAPTGGQDPETDHSAALPIERPLPALRGRAAGRCFPSTRSR